MRKLALLFAVLLATGSAVRADESPRRSITTSGDAVVYVVPDEATISFGVQTYAAKLDDAKTANDRTAAAVVAAVKACGVDDKSISTDDVSVSIRYDRDSAGTVLGYDAARSYVVKLEGIKLVSKVVDAAVHSGANRLSGVDFSTTELRKYRDQARKMAAKAAKEKAADMAAEFDAALGPVRTINLVSSRWDYSNPWGNTSQNQASEAPQAGDESDQATPAGQIAVRASITVTFDLQDAPPKAAAPPPAK
jgi:uncharacterized protein YggE